ncbi:ComF family protein [Tamilnaduibacter salinus]|uniref:ComF family protein n=1 Tax=Tamilnaduibacter salinus TaxID=1484056 RepID=UPI001403EE8D|nr:ComF family protein [Tamilnaduibacter salinus]
MRCALPGRFGERGLCGACHRNPPPFDRVVAPWAYQFPVSALISRFKYQKQRPDGKPLARLFAERLRDAGRTPPQALIPVPMAPSRERRRGFNQAEEIAIWMSRQLNIPVYRQSLTRANHTQTQSGLSRRERLANLKGAYRVRGPVPSHVALVDDVMTTGATVRAASRILREHGAATIEVWVLARTPNT